MQVEGQQLNGPGSAAAIRAASTTAVASGSSKAVLGHATGRSAALTGLQVSDIRKEAIGSLVTPATAGGYRFASNQGLRHLGTAVARQDPSAFGMQTTQLGVNRFVQGSITPNSALQSAGQAKLVHPTYRVDQAASPRGLTLTSMVASTGGAVGQPRIVGA